MIHKVSEVKQCDGCPMRRLFSENSFVPPKFGSGNRLAIAEAPGESEAATGEPLVGGAGKWFEAMLHKAGILKSEVTKLNCINCRPPNNVFPTDAAARKYISKEDGLRAVEHCYQAYVKPVIQSRQWERIDLLGDKPLSIVAQKQGGIMKWRGSPVEIPDAPGTPCIPTCHPAYIARDQIYFPICVNDLMKDPKVPPEFYTPYPTLEEVCAFKEEEFVYDIETNGFSKEIRLVGITASPFQAMAIPFRGAYIPEIKRIFRRAKRIIGHNSLQFDLPILQYNDVQVSRDVAHFDTMLMQHLAFPDFPHDLEFVGSQFTSKPAWKGEKGSLEWYNCRDCDVTWQAYQELKEILTQENLWDVYWNVSVPMAKICKLMHDTGIKVDPSQIGKVRESLQQEMSDLEDDLVPMLQSFSKPIRKRVPAPKGTKGANKKPKKFIMVPDKKTIYPWRSSTEKAKYLYGTDQGCLAFEAITDVKSGNITTGKIALDKLKGRIKQRSDWDQEKKEEVRKSISSLRRLNQIDETLTTFAKESMTKIDRMFPHFNVHGTSSGRLSSSDPNLQNIPEASRCIYVPSHPGWKLIDVDKSQLENRLTAYFANDYERLKRLEVPNFSEHKYAASLFLGVDYEDVVKDNDKDAPYGKAKRIVHLSNYGGGPKKIANLYDMDFQETKRLQNIWKLAIQPTIKWQEKCAEEAHQRGYLVNPFGRKRWFFTSSYYAEALSFLPQSAGFDIVAREMIGLIYDRIGMTQEEAEKIVPVVCAVPQPAKLLLQVHDSLVWECPNEMVDIVIGCLKKVMLQPWKEIGGMSIPIGIKVGDNWGMMEDYK